MLENLRRFSQTGFGSNLLCSAVLEEGIMFVAIDVEAGAIGTSLEIFCRDN